MLRFRCVEIRVQCCGFSKDLEETATFEKLPAILHLETTVSNSQHS